MYGRTLVDLIRRNLDRDPHDARPYDVQDAVLRQDMEWVLVAGDAVTESLKDQHGTAAQNR